jgi:hypothetical protein
MRSHRNIPELVYSQLWELEPDAIVEFAGKFCLRRVGGVVIDVDVESASVAVGDWRGEAVVGGAGTVAGGARDEGFAISIDAARSVS